MSRFRLAIATTAFTLASGSCNEVTAPALAGGLRIAPSGSITMLVGPGGGQELKFTAHSQSRDGSAVELKNTVWRSTAAAVVTVSANGVASAHASGAAVIIARAGAMYDSVWVLVRPVPARSLAIALDSIALEFGPQGGSVRSLSAVARDSVGHRLSSQHVEWRISDASIAVVTLQGVLTAVSVGDTYVHASVDGRQDSSLVIVSPTTGLPSGVAVRILGAQWTQGIQRSDGSIPMISGGRAAVVNVTTSATGSIAMPTQFVLRLFNARGVRVHAETTSVSILSGASSNREPTLQFLVPSALLREGLTWDLVRDPNRLRPGGADGAETFPAAERAVVEVVTAPPLRIRFVPIVLAAHHDVRGLVSSEWLDYYTRTVREFFPHGRIIATSNSAHRTYIPFGIAGYGGDATFWAALLAEIDQKRIADPEHADAYWVGVVRPPTGFSYSMIGGMAYIPSDGQSFGPGTRTSAVISANWIQSEAASRNLVAHELGHNLGRLHAPCGTSGTIDAAFPDARGVIGEGAHDTFAWERGLTTGAAALDGRTADFMGYCSPRWISAHTYSGMLAFRDLRTVALRELAVRQRVLLVRGAVEGSVARIDTAAVMEAIPSAPESGGDWLLEGLSVDGAVISRWPFTLVRLDHAPTVQHFAIALPLSDETQSRLVTLRVTGPSGSAERRLPE